MAACMEAGKPGPMHAHLAKSLGTWNGKSTMWMEPGAEGIQGECVFTVTSIMDGRFVKCEMTGENPVMGTAQGFGLYGYDNVAEKFQSTWIMNCGTGMMNGTGDLSSDGSTITWTFTHHCPIAKKEVTMREIERITGANSKTYEMFGTDPKSGKEFKMMEVALTRAPGSAPARTTTVPTNR